MPYWKINGLPATVSQVERVLKEHVFRISIAGDSINLQSVTTDWRNEVFWAVGYGILIGLVLAPLIFYVLYG
jgi:sensor c-di-GMP phosphodiesterase-like protein